MAKNRKKLAVTEIAESEKEVVRVTFRFHGPELAQVREVRDMLSLNAELDAARYIMQRGLEAMAATLASRRTTTKMAADMSAEKIIALMGEKFGMTAEDLKKLG